MTDLQLAREKQREFDEWGAEHNKQIGIEMGVQVLTTGFWPTYKATDLVLPEEMAEGVRVFKVSHSTLHELLGESLLLAFVMPSMNLISFFGFRAQMAIFKPICKIFL